MGQFLHLAFKNKKDNIGMLSNHLIFSLHFGQKDLLKTTPLFIGKRYIQTLEKLPQIAPKIKKARYNTD